jgi:hypothetical protein
MPRGGGDLPAPQVETPDGLRDMARRARCLAMGIHGDEGATRPPEFAKELEAACGGAGDCGGRALSQLVGHPSSAFACRILAYDAGEEIGGYHLGVGVELDRNIPRRGLLHDRAATSPDSKPKGRPSSGLPKTRSRGW